MYVVVCQLLVSVSRVRFSRARARNDSTRIDFTPTTASRVACFTTRSLMIRATRAVIQTLLESPRSRFERCFKRRVVLGSLSNARTNQPRRDSSDALRVTIRTTRAATRTRDSYCVSSDVLRLNRRTCPFLMSVSHVCFSCLFSCPFLMSVFHVCFHVRFPCLFLCLFYVSVLCVCFVCLFPCLFFVSVFYVCFVCLFFVSVLYVCFCMSVFVSVSRVCFHVCFSCLFSMACTEICVR